MPVQQILSELPKLTQDELAEVRQRVLALSALDGVETEDDWLLKGIISYLSERGLEETVPPYFKLRNRRQYQGYMGKAEKVRRAFEKRYELSKLEKLSLGRLLARCLGEYIEEWREVNFSGLLTHADLCLQALDKCFPGYLRAGMIKVLVRGVPRVSG